MAATINTAEYVSKLEAENQSLRKELAQAKSEKIVAESMYRDLLDTVGDIRRRINDHFQG